jgi:hypothetical protein
MNKAELEEENKRLEERIADLENTNSGSLLVQMEMIITEMRGIKGILAPLVDASTNMAVMLHDLTKLQDLTYKQTVGWTKALHLESVEKKLAKHGTFSEEVSIQEENKDFSDYVSKPRLAMDGSLVEGTFDKVTETHKDKEKRLKWKFDTITITPIEFTAKAIKVQEYPNFLALSMMKGSVEKLQKAQNVQVPNFYPKLLNKQEA